MWQVYRLFGLLWFSLVCIAQPAPTFRIAGRVVRHADNRPVKNARVAVTMVEHPDRSLEARTGENGEFSFVGLTPAKYQLRVHYRGWSQLFQQDEDFSTAIVVGAGLDSEHVLFPIDSPASISGSVLDDEGEPVPGAMVFLFGRSMFRGRSQIGLKGQYNTVSDGTFRVSRLAAGTYYVAVTGRPWYAQNPLAPTTPKVQSPLDVAYPLIYYEAAATPEGATPLVLEEGMQAEIQFALHAVPALHIKFDGVEAAPEQPVQTSLSVIGPGGVLLNLPNWGTGSEMSGVAPGSYVLSATVNGPKGQSAIGSEKVNFTSDITVHLDGATKSSVSGRVVLDGGIPRGLRLVMQNANGQSAQLHAIHPDGSFDIPEIAAGRYALLLGNAAHLFIQKVAARGGGYENGELDIRPGAQIELTITAAQGLTKVNGLAVSAKKPMAGAMVLLVPQDPGRRHYLPRDQSDSDGTFTLFGITPGRYTLVAIQNGRGLAYADPAVIGPYLKLGQVLDFPLAKGATVEVEVQPRLRF